MKKQWIIACLSGLFAVNIQAQLPAKYPYQDTKLTAEQRADDLLPRLTLEEKVALMQNNSPAIPRLGIKPYEWWNEALHGVARAGLATVFPQAIGMGASFNDKLLYEVFDAVSDEARAKNRRFNENGSYRRYQGLTMWTPNVNIFRDPRWGRGQETYGEDPYLSGQLGMAVVRGLQGPEDAEYDKLHACAKHFAVHSGPEWNRHSFNAENIAPRDLWETYLPAFKDLVQKAGVKEVMCAYNRYEGDPCCGSERLLNQILRNEWGFKGMVVSDCGAISDFYSPKKHFTHPDAASASAAAVLSGTDVECGSSYKSLTEAVAKGAITEDKINISVRRLLIARFQLGEMNEKHPWAHIPYSVVDSPKHKELALRMAHETIVLLQNKNQILPLNKDIKIAVLGPNANDSVMQWGNYNGFPSQTTTLLKAIQKRFPASQIIYEPACGHTDAITLQSLFNQCSIDGKPGFSAEYWNNREYQGDIAAVDQLSTPFHFSSQGAIAFAAGVNLKDFTAIYRSTFRPDHNGSAAFRLMTNGGVTLSIDGKIVAERSNVKNPDNLYHFIYEAGKAYNIELKFIQERNDPFLNFDLAQEKPVNIPELLTNVKDADVVLFAGGISPLLEGESMSVSAPGFKGGDRLTIELPDAQRNILKELKKAGKKVIFINYSGSAMALTPETESCDAILQAWYPGQDGGTAVADVLFGDYNPAGRLPITFYKNTDQLPDYEEYSMKNRTYRFFKEEPLFPFGYGLSYTKFTYGKVKADKKSLAKNETLTLQIPVTNIGNHDGEEVVQVYLRRPSDVEGPAKTLRAFQRVKIAKGTTQTVKLELPYENFAWFDTATNTMRTLQGKYEVLYGGSSKEKDLQTVSILVK